MQPVKGHLEILEKGFGFLRDIDNNLLPGPEDVFTPANVIRKFGLAEGSFVEGKGVRGKKGQKNLRLQEVERINGVPLKDYDKVKPLHDKTSINPEEKFLLAKDGSDFTGRVLDMVTPIGKGQRGLIISPPKSGKTTLLKHMASAICQNHPNTHVFMLLIDERPEEVTDFRRELVDAKVLYSSSDQDVAKHVRMARLAMNVALREVETGKDVVVFIDSLTRLARTFNVETQSHGRTLSGGLGADALRIPRQIFGAARNLENGGSLTIIASILVDTGSRMDDVIYQEFKGSGNMDLKLSPKCADRRIWPAININDSGTRKDHLLLSPGVLDENNRVRRRLAPLDEVSAMEQLLEYLKETPPRAGAKN